MFELFCNLQSEGGGGRVRWAERKAFDFRNRVFCHAGEVLCQTSLVPQLIHTTAVCPFLIVSIFVNGRERFTRIPDLFGACTESHAHEGLCQCHAEEAVAVRLGSGGALHRVVAVICHAPKLSGLREGGFNFA